MKIIKSINNNFAVAEDSAGNQCIVSGKGIGFGTVPREVTDLGVINRIYYDVDSAYIAMINDFPEEIIDVSSKIIDYTRLVIDNSISSNIVFTLADHINFCIQRYQKHMNIKLPITNDIEFFFEKEMKIGKYGLKLIKKQLHVYLPKEEAAYIALHIINAEENFKSKEEINDDEIIEKITELIEEEYQLRINKENFNYSRFVSHMHYLLKRGKCKELLSTDNRKLYHILKEDQPLTYVCTEKVSKYFVNETGIQLTDEEKLYLMLHINRLCTREDCNQ